MDIIFHGRHDSTSASENLLHIIDLLKKRYQIGGFCDMHLSLTLVDQQGMEVDLVDSETEEVLRYFEVYPQIQKISPRKKAPTLRLIVNRP